MGKPRIRLLVCAGLIAAGATGWAQSPGAQAPGPAGTRPRGFSSQILVAQLSLYLPEEATRGMNRGFADGANGPARNAPSAQDGQGSSAGGAGGSSAGGSGAGGTGGSGAGGAGRSFPPMQIPRNPKLFLTKEQITRLLPILIALRDNPLPTPSKAKQVGADVDAVLTAEQKAEWADFQKKLQALMEQFRQRAGANGPAGQGAMNGDGAPGDGVQRDGAPGGGGPGGGAPQATLLQRRQRQLDAFVKILQDRLKLVGA